MNLDDFTVCRIFVLLCIAFFFLNFRFRQESVFGWLNLRTLYVNISSCCISLTIDISKVRALFFLQWKKNVLWWLKCDFSHRKPFLLKKMNFELKNIQRIQMDIESHFFSNLLSIHCMSSIFLFSCHTTTEIKLFCFFFYSIYDLII